MKTQANLPHLFSALADPTRIAIVERLLRDGEQTAGALASQHDISKPAISRHLRVLQDAGFIDRRVDRQFRVFRVRPAAFREIGDWMRVFEPFWQNAFDRLERTIANRENGNGNGD